MFNKKSLPVVLVIFVAGIFAAFQTIGLGKPPATKYEKILQQVGVMLEQGHYSPKKIDDAFSKEVFSKYLEAIDPEKQIFLKPDVAQLKQFEDKIDDEIHGSPLQSFKAISDVYAQRLLEYLAAYKGILDKPFNFDVDETLVDDKSKMDFAATEKERTEIWRKRLKYQALVRYADLLATNEKNKAQKDYKSKTNAEMEKEAREKVLQSTNRIAERLRNKFTEEDRFNEFVNTITSCMDPHTTFFPPIEKRSFDEQMSGRFYGIGASLRQEEGNIKIMTLVTGSPAWKSGQIQVGDIITKVGQGNEEPLDMAGYDTEDAVKIIRGKKGTEVRLTLKKTDGTTKVVSLIRDEIVLDETFARSAIVNEGSRKIGYIYLPEFYADWERPNGAKSAEDVAKEIQKLKAEQIDGIIIDLRNNGGGSLFDVIQMVGLFIDEGPVVQVKDRQGVPSVLRDKDKGVLYDGPLAVMVNEFSASASEIFAAAIQDYKRGVIIGSTSTYGKGTVQRNIGLEGGRSGLLASGDDDASANLGTVKLTLQKFYRINGGSTQLKGVTPDIVLPDQFEYLQYREKDNPDALQWDEIARAKYTPWSNGADISTIKQTEGGRIKSDSVFEQIKANTRLLSELNDKVYTLNLKKYQEEQKQIREIVRQIDKLTKTDKANPVELLPSDVSRFSNDEVKLERQQQWLKNLKSDIYLNETVSIVNNIISHNAIVRSK
ncbi:carboxy terminal-processing peptidase [Agriterribacter sp.]|uniref:carboxy terminal-processing peptidase n=1 Tax=Agriterribacter sp. TaxID=2821509 RepID=UPI002C8EFEBF|nr:carboxy terminal-processing peptidase [Agriterribacter sp.]HRO47487.1 carboxy terminal-processing peptidase [Agriterribacter sp.]HRQ18598.1 carboxy terminal-processing peptidase [Agriterribacter sp.]